RARSSGATAGADRARPEVGPGLLASQVLRGRGVRALTPRPETSCPSPNNTPRSAAATCGGRITRSACPPSTRAPSASSRGCPTGFAPIAVITIAARSSRPSRGQSHAPGSLSAWSGTAAVGARPEGCGSSDRDGDVVSATSPRVALCFPGQGSQAASMAAGLEETDLGRRLLAVAATLGVDLGPAFGGDEELIRPTEVAQPALVFTELVLAAALPRDLSVVGVAGHSIGELAAYAVAGAVLPEAALRLAVERGRLMAAMRDGTMAAVLGLDAATATRLCAQSAGTVVVANLNAPGQVVVSGEVDAVTVFSATACAAGARRVLPLKVSGAFHSPLMVGAASEFTRLLDGVELRAPSVPVVTNVDAAAVSDAI